MELHVCEVHTYAGMHADLVRCARVCSKWNCLAEDEYLWITHCKSLLSLQTRQTVLTWYVMYVRMYCMYTQ